MFFGRNLLYLVSPWNRTSYDYKKWGAQGSPKDGRGDIFQNRIQALEPKLPVNSGMRRICAESARYVPAECREKWLELPVGRIRYLAAGEGDPLVLLHGLLGYSFSWRRVIGPLAHCRQVVAPDMPGSGFSDSMPALDGRLSSAADRLAAFLDALGISACEIMASSYGGATALMLATQQPERFRRMILVSPANSWSRIGAKTIQLLRIPPVRWLVPRLGKRVRFLHDYFLRRLYGDPSAITPETYRGYSEPISLGGRLDHAVRIIQTWNDDMRELRLGLHRAAEIPVLLVWGTQDAAVDLASAEELRRNFRTCQIALIDGAGHLPYEERPEDFLRCVTEFLETKCGR